MTTPIPTRRASLSADAPKQYAAMFRLERSIELEGPVRDLIALRASQINGCAFCLDMHMKDALAAGEQAARLWLLEAWREAPVYDDRERAALELCEALTLVSERGVPEDVWERARAAFGGHELSQLVFAITVINAWNRLNIAAGTEPGHYQPGMFGLREQPAGAAA